MQKLDFVNNLQIIVNRLQSNEIVNKFIAGFNNPGQGYDYGSINPLLFISKSNYDQIKTDSNLTEIIKSLQGEIIYSEDNLYRLTTILRTTKAESILINSNAISLYNFHKTLISTLTLSKDILISKPSTLTTSESLEDGIIVFQIVIENEGLETEKYVKILNALDELVSTLSKILSEDESKSEIILLDSGSDTNLGIKTGIETAKSIFLIFKEVWDFATNYKHYKLKQKNQTLLESLSVRAEIKNKIDEGVISEEEGRQYMHIIKTRTDDLIGMKVLPKQIVLDNSVIENKKLLSEFEGIKLLSNGDNNEN